jgi:hypothetical protein
MEFYKMILGSCQLLVYSNWKHEITFGVAGEVNHAIDIGIPVFEPVRDKFIQIHTAKGSRSSFES